MIAKLVRPGGWRLGPSPNPRPPDPQIPPEPEPPPPPGEPPMPRPGDPAPRPELGKAPKPVALPRFLRRSGQKAGDDRSGADRQRAVEGVAHLGVRIDAEQVEQRGGQVFGADRVARGVRAQAGAGAMHVAALNAAARQKDQL